MALIKCPECGRQNVSDSAKTCPGCGFHIQEYFHSDKKTSDELCTNILIENSNTDTTYNQHSNAKFIIIGTVIIAVIWVVWYSSTRCSYPGCFEHKFASKSYCSYHLALLTGYSSYSSSSYSYDNRSKYDLIIYVDEVYTNSSSSYCTGRIENNGDESFKFVRVKGAFKDCNGNTIETGASYAVGDEGLKPGESTSFRIRCNKNSDINSCTVTVYDYD